MAATTGVDVQGSEPAHNAVEVARFRAGHVLHTPADTLADQVLGRNVVLLGEDFELVEKQAGEFFPTLERSQEKDVVAQRRGQG